MASSKDYLRLHFIVFLWGFSAILGKLISLPTPEMVVYRAILAVAGMGLVMYFSKQTFKVSVRDLGILFLIGILVSLHWLAFFGSGRVANVSVSLVGFATNSLWAAFLEPWFNRERIKKYQVFLGLIVLSGLYIIFSFNFQYKLGLALGVFAGFSSALFSVFNSRMVKRVSSYAITFYEMIGVFAGALLFLPIYQTFWAPDHAIHLVPQGWDWLYLVLLAGGCSVYAYTVAVELMKRVSVFMIQLCLNLEPLYGMAMAVVLFPATEKMPPNFYIGTLVILCAVISYPLMKKRFEKTVLID
jgi:drug/metabolite transporter (DMT)-like permease